MEESNEKIAPRLKLTKPPGGLYEVILGRIRTEKKLESARKRAACFSIALGGSVAGFFVSFAALREVFLQSGLWQVASLVFSDSGAVADNWHDFCLFFLESLPVTELIIFLSALFLLLASLKYLFRYAGTTAFLLKSLQHS